MDESLRALERAAAKAGAGDAALLRRYRGALLRQRGVDRRAADARLDALEGVWAVTRLSDLGQPAWRLLYPGPAGAGRLAPGPPRRPLRARWRAPGALVWRSHGVALLDRGGDLEARDPDGGELLWRVEGPGVPRSAVLLEESDFERCDVLGWVAAPWGAVQLAAFFHSEEERRRVGTWTPEGRSTRTAVVGRGPTDVELTLRVVVPNGGGWSAEPPDELVEVAGTGEPLCESELALEAWDQELLDLSLEVDHRLLAIRWGDDAPAWTVLRVDAADGLAPVVRPAGWSVPGEDDPFPARPGELVTAAVDAALDPDLLEGRTLRPPGRGLRDLDKEAALLPGPEGRASVQLGGAEHVALAEEA